MSVGRQPGKPGWLATVVNLTGGTGRRLVPAERRGRRPGKSATWLSGPRYCDASACVQFWSVVVDAGSILDTGLHEQQPSKNADLLTFSTTLDNVMRSHFPSVYGGVAVRLVSCPNVCSEALSLLARLVSSFSHPGS